MTLLLMTSLVCSAGALIVSIFLLITMHQLSRCIETNQHHTALLTSTLLNLPAETVATLPRPSTAATGHVHIPPWMFADRWGDQEGEEFSQGGAE